MVLAWQQQIRNNIAYPSSIKGLGNGQFPDSALVPIHGPRGETIGRLCPEAARAWDVMVAAAIGDGVTLDVTDSYRDLNHQRSIFVDRYRDTDQGAGSRVCNGKRWFLRKGQATAACPGTSNHGLGLAVDNHFHGEGLAWLEQHAQTFGFAWEIASEDWHIHYCPGDETPPAVLEGDDVTDQDKTDIISAVAAHVDARVNTAANDLATSIGRRLDAIEAAIAKRP